MKISVLGSGCATCRKLDETVRRVVAAEGITAELEYSDDVQRIVELGLMRSPVLVIDGRPVKLSSMAKDDVKDAILGAANQR